MTWPCRTRRRLVAGTGRPRGRLDGCRGLLEAHEAVVVEVFRVLGRCRPPQLQGRQQAAVSSDASGNGNLYGVGGVLPERRSRLRPRLAAPCVVRTSPSVSCVITMAVPA